jgi:hypothetical protein
VKIVQIIAATHPGTAHPTDPDYWPLYQGAYWEFGPLFRCEVLGEATIDGATGWLATWVLDPDSVLCSRDAGGWSLLGEHLPSGSLAVPPCDAGWNVYDPPIVGFRFPATPGDVETAQTCRGEIEYSVVSVDSTIVSPRFGVFESCYVYRIESPHGLNWGLALAPDIGPVVFWQDALRIDLTACSACPAPVYPSTWGHLKNMWK